MESQFEFESEPIEQIPDPDKKYYFSHKERSKKFTYLMKLLFLIKNNPTLIHKIAQYKSDINTKNKKGWTALMIACVNLDTFCSMEIVDELIKNGANVNEENSRGETPLMIICQTKNSLDTVKLLLNNGAHLNALDSGKCTALMYACENNNVQVVKELINFRPHLDAQDNDGDTALIFASRHYCSEIIIALIKAGANTKIENNSEKDALHYACLHCNDDVETIKQLIGFERQINTEKFQGFIFACKKKYVKLVDYFINIGVNVNNIGDANRTALMCACENYDAETITKLIKAGADIDIVDKKGTNALMLACEKYVESDDSDVKSIQELIKLSTNIDLKDRDGNSALMYACGNSVKCVTELIKAGVDLNVQNNDGVTPLMRACNKHNKKIIMLLIENGVNINKQDNDGWTALMYACNNFSAETVEIIKYFIKNDVKLNTMTHKKRNFFDILCSIYLDKPLFPEIIKQIVYFLDKQHIESLLTDNNDIIINILFEAYKYDNVKMAVISRKLNNEQFSNWTQRLVYKFLIIDKIPKHAKYIYDLPGNIFCMCSETLFYIKQKNNKLLNKVPNKLKFLFDINNENDLQKIYYYV